MFESNKAKEKTVLLSHYRAVFSTPEGKKVLEDLMKRTLCYDSTFDPDPYQAAFNEGQRAVIMRIVQTINTDPEIFTKMSGQSENDYEI